MNAKSIKLSEQAKKDFIKFYKQQKENKKLGNKLEWATILFNFALNNYKE